MKIKNDKAPRGQRIITESGTKSSINNDRYYNNHNTSNVVYFVFMLVSFNARTT